MQLKRNDVIQMKLPEGVKDAKMFSVDGTRYENPDAVGWIWR